MFGKVLVPTDFSEYAKKTILCLTRIPGIQEEVLQHVVDATLHTRHILRMRESSWMKKKISLNIWNLL